MRAKPLPSVEYLFQRFDYDREAGKLYWRYQPDWPAQWNVRFAGAEAGCDTNGYISVNLDGHLLRAHRIIWAMDTGAWPEGILDHINHHTADNRMSNLRQVTVSENSKNMLRRSRNTTGVTGVYQNPKSLKYIAQIRYNKKTHHLGSFDDKEDARKARREAERKHGYHENNGATREMLGLD